MKNLLVLLVIIGFASSCQCKKIGVENSQKTQTICPDESVCTTEIIKDSTLVITLDGANKPYYTLDSKKGTTVYRYTMTEKKDLQYVDGGYREEIIFELPSNYNEGTLSGKDILETNALFGVFCYCKGKAGYYKINEGTITKDQKTIAIEFPAMVEGQKITKLKLAL